MAEKMTFAEAVRLAAQDVISDEPWDTPFTNGKNFLNRLCTLTGGKFILPDATIPELNAGKKALYALAEDPEFDDVHACRTAILNAAPTIDKLMEAK